MFEDCLNMPLIDFATKFYYCKQIAKIRARAHSDIKRIVIPHPKIRANPVSKLYSKYCLHKLTAQILGHLPFKEDQTAHYSPQLVWLCAWRSNASLSSKKLKGWRSTTEKMTFVRRCQSKYFHKMLRQLCKQFMMC